MIRKDYPDLVFRTEKEKWEAVVKEIEELHRIGRPVLVGTTSIEKSEKLSAMLKKRRIPHHVLNAKYHEKEAEIVAQAGRLKAVTIATNMAGRGTDIMLGGNPEFLAKEELKKKYGTLEGIPKEEWERTLNKYRELCEKERQKVVELGGLHIIGTERHESRRIDNQLRGRAGRQGDPGSSRFYLSLEDDLLRIFGGDKLKALMSKLGMKEGEPIEHPWVTKAIENAQKKVEAHNFEIRKHLLEYDDVMNKQREVVYAQRRKILEGADLREEILGIVRELIDSIVASSIEDKEINPEKVAKEFARTFNIKIQPEEIADKKEEELAEYLYQKALEVYEEKEKLAGRENIASLERMIFLYTLDSLWKDHLLNMDHLRDVIGLRGYGQRDPLNEYKRESFELFADMIERLKRQIVETLYRIEVRVEGEEVEKKVKEKKKKRRYIEHRGENEQPQVQTVRRKGRKIGRNEPCPCGSGKKYKHCCGKNA